MSPGYWMAEGLSVERMTVILMTVFHICGQMPGMLVLDYTGQEDTEGGQTKCYESLDYPRVSKKLVIYS